MKKNELIRIILAFLVIAVITLVMREFRSSNASADDFPDRAITASETLVDISISDGSTGSQIANQLFERGIIESSQSFFNLAVSDERAKRIAPGVHQLNLKISSRQALEQLLDSKRMPNLVRIIEGSWNVEIFEMLKKSGFSESQITQAIKEVKLPQGFRSLEGLLFPAQYSFALGTTATQALQSMIVRFQDEFSSLDIPDNLDLSSQELLIIASIIQAEGGRQDFSKVSAVIRNRLKIGMPLQMDSTIHYAQKLRGNIFLSTKSTLLKSPFNTYKRYGLPPGPIGNPGLEAIKAAINPAVGNWLYFVTVSPGDTRFTSEITEFNQWKALYIKNRKAGAFK